MGRARESSERPPPLVAQPRSLDVLGYLFGVLGALGRSQLAPFLASGWALDIRSYNGRRLNG